MHITDGWLWTGLIAAPLAWATQLVLGYWSEEVACSSRGRATMVAGLEVDHFVLTVSVVTALVALGGLGVAVAAALFAPREDSLGRVRFMAGGGIFVSAVFFGAIVLAGSAVLALDPCEA